MLLPLLLLTPSTTAVPAASPNPALSLHAGDAAVSSISPADKRRDVKTPEPPGYLNAFGGNGCYGDAGYQGGPMDEGPFCFRVEGKGSVHWALTNSNQ